MQIVEQGRLAETFLAISEKQPASMPMVQELVRDTAILQGSYNQAFIYRNPYIEAERDEQGNLRIELADPETILREIWVNDRHELDWPVEVLARHRLALYESFKVAWRDQNHPAVLDVLYRSNFPFALLRALHRFVICNKRVMIEIHARYGPLMSGYASYYLAVFGLKLLWLRIWQRRIVRPKII